MYDAKNLVFVDGSRLQSSLVAVQFSQSRHFAGFSARPIPFEFEKDKFVCLLRVRYDAHMYWFSQSEFQYVYVS